jgi:hypothetical protein
VEQALRAETLAKDWGKKAEDCYQFREISIFGGLLLSLNAGIDYQ